MILGMLENLGMELLLGVVGLAMEFVPKIWSAQGTSLDQKDSSQLSFHNVENS